MISEVEEKHIPGKKKIAARSAGRREKILRMDIETTFHNIGINEVNYTLKALFINYACCPAQRVYIMIRWVYIMQRVHIVISFRNIILKLSE